MPRKPSEEKCKTMLQTKIKKNISEMKTSKKYTTPKQAVAVAYSQLSDECDFPAPMKKTRGRPKVKGGMFGNIDFPSMGVKADTPSQARRRKRDIQKQQEREMEREALYGDAMTREDYQMIDEAMASLNEEEKELLKQFSPKEQQEILKARGAGMCKRGGMMRSSPEAPSPANRNVVQGIRGVIARVNALRAQLEMEAIPPPDLTRDSEETAEEHNRQLQELLQMLLQEESSLRRELTRVLAIQQRQASSSSASESTTQRRLF